MEYSPNFNLSLPSSTDDELADVDVLTENFRIIDEIISKINSKVEPIERIIISEGDNTHGIVRTKMNLRDIAVVVETPVVTNNFNITGSFICSDSKDSNRRIYILNLHTSSAFTTSKKYHIYCSEFGNGSRFNTFKTTQTLSTREAINARTYISAADFLYSYNDENLPSRIAIVNEIEIYAGDANKTDVFPVGTKISIYGVVAE